MSLQSAVSSGHGHGRLRLPGLSGGRRKPGRQRAPWGLRGAGGGPSLLHPARGLGPPAPAPAPREPGGSAVPAVMLLKINTAPCPRGETPRVLIFPVDDLDDDAVASPPPSSFLLPVSDSFRMFISLAVPIRDVAELTAGSTPLLFPESFLCSLALAPPWLSANSLQL